MQEDFLLSELPGNKHPHCGKLQFAVNTILPTLRKSGYPALKSILTSGRLFITFGLLPINNW